MARGSQRGPTFTGRGTLKGKGLSYGPDSYKAKPPSLTQLAQERRLMELGLSPEAAREASKGDRPSTPTKVTATIDRRDAHIGQHEATVKAALADHAKRQAEIKAHPEQFTKKSVFPKGSVAIDLTDDTETRRMRSHPALDAAIKSDRQNADAIKASREKAASIREVNRVAEAARRAVEVQGHNNPGQKMIGPDGKQFTAGRTVNTMFGPLVENADKPGTAFSLHTVKPAGTPGAPDLAHLAKENKIPADPRAGELAKLAKQGERIAQRKREDEAIAAALRDRDGKSPTKQDIRVARNYLGDRPSDSGSGGRNIDLASVRKDLGAPEVARVKPMTGVEKELLAKSQAMSRKQAEKIVSEGDKFTGGGIQPHAGMPGWDEKSAKQYHEARQVLSEHARAANATVNSAKEDDRRDRAAQLAKRDRAAHRAQEYYNKSQDGRKRVPKGNPRGGQYTK